MYSGSHVLFQLIKIHPNPTATWSNSSEGANLPALYIEANTDNMTAAGASHPIHLRYCGRRSIVFFWQHYSFTRWPIGCQ